MSYIYLASPYSHTSAVRRTERYLKVLEYTALTLMQRIPIFSPIIHCHDMALKYSMPKDAGFWKWYNEEMLKPARELYVLKLDGWEDSVGVRGEIGQAMGLGIPITYVEEA